MFSWDDSGLTTDAAAELARFTDLRHQMVHRGTKPNIVRQTAQDCVDLVGRIAEALNSEAVRHYHAVT